MTDIPKYAKIRSFIAIDLPAVIVEGLKGIQGKLKEGNAKVSWVKPENIHLTLKFLGEVEEKSLEDILCVIKEAASSHRAINLSVEGLGCFPSISNPRVVWIGIRSDAESILSLQRDIEKGLEPIGFRREKRIYHPHLTLGRIRSLKDRKCWKEMVDRFKDIRLGSFEADRVIFFKSDLNPKGAVYTKLGEAFFRN
ncbi:MAG: RNA 2',3'-cyclic phosphodiesterase [Thermodesulfobacteriota bacterium]